MAGGNCENRARCETCTKTIGVMFGWCNIDFVPKEQEEK